MSETQWLRAGIQSSSIQGVDRKANVLRGYVVAQAGVFKDRRGEFNGDGLSQIAAMGNAAAHGLKSRFGHPTLSDDGIGKFLGRSKDFRLGQTLDERTGKQVAAVRADMHFNPTALKSADGGQPLGDKVMEIAETDPHAISSSLVILPKQIPQIDAKGKPLTDAKGEDLPPLWFPVELHASDIVDTGDAVDSLLSANLDAAGIDIETLLRFDGPARIGVQVLDKVFERAGRDVIQARLHVWLEKYLELRFGAAVKTSAPALEKFALRMQEAALTVNKGRYPPV